MHSSDASIVRGPVLVARLAAALTTCVGVALGLAAGCEAPASRPSSWGVEHVVIVGVDGLSPRGLQAAATPALDRLLAEGAHTLEARAVLPTTSSPNWASMIMGAGPPQHGITSNAWRRDEAELPPMVTGTEDLFPTLFGVLRAQWPAARIGAVYEWDGFGRLFEKSAVDLDVVGADARDTTDRAVDWIDAAHPTLLFVHLDLVDAAGHRYGWESPEYLAVVAEADGLVGEIVGALEAAGLLERTLLIVSTDHGGLGTRHGGESPEEVLIPFVLRGPGVLAGHRIEASVNVFDTAATAAWALGLAPPQAWIGRPVRAAFGDAP